MENETTIEVGETYRFADLWSGNGDEAEIFESGAVWIGNDDDDMPIVADHIGLALMAKRKMPSKLERKRKNIYIQILWIGIILNIVRALKR